MDEDLAKLNQNTWEAGDRYRNKRNDVEISEVQKKIANRNILPFYFLTLSPYTP